MIFFLEILHISKLKPYLCKEGRNLNKLGLQFLGLTFLLWGVFCVIQLGVLLRQKKYTSVPPWKLPNKVHA